MRKFLWIPICVFFLNIICSSCYKDNEEQLYPDTSVCTDTTVSKFTSNVLPILSASCNYTGCHNTSSAASGVILDTYNGTKVQVGNGRLMGSINHSSGYSAMPKGTTKLSNCNIAIIQKWINAGALNN